MIDLNRFSQPVEAIVPLIDGKGVYHGRQIVQKGFTGYYNVSFGDKIKVLGEANKLEAYLMAKGLPKFKGIAYGDSIIPLNFSAAKFLGYQETISVLGMEAPLGYVVVTHRWEDDTLLYGHIDGGYNQLPIILTKKKAESGDKLEGKDITPEMRYFYLLVRLDLARLTAWQEIDKMAISKEAKQKAIEKFKETFYGRTKEVVEQAGGQFISVAKQGQRATIVWKVGKEKFTSIVNNDLRILDLGYCASGYDKDHSISSAIQLAKLYMKEGVLYKTNQDE